MPKGGDYRGGSIVVIEETIETVSRDPSIAIEEKKEYNYINIIKQERKEVLLEAVQRKQWGEKKPKLRNI